MKNYEWLDNASRSVKAEKSGNKRGSEQLARQCRIVLGTEHPYHQQLNRVFEKLNQEVSNG